MGKGRWNRLKIGVMHEVMTAAHEAMTVIVERRRKERDIERRQQVVE
jgi:hypothetical protein